MKVSQCDEGYENDYEVIIATNLNVDIGAEEEVDLDSDSRNSQLLDSQLLKGWCWCSFLHWLIQKFALFLSVLDMLLIVRTMHTFLAHIWVSQIGIFSIDGNETK